MHPLQLVFDKAIEQATKGKGERHGGESLPFMDQPWVHYGKMHGRGFLTGQAVKKLEEAASTRSGDAFITEVLGAIVYAAMAVIQEQGATIVEQPTVATKQCQAKDATGKRCCKAAGHRGRHTSKEKK